MMPLLDEPAQVNRIRCSEGEFPLVALGQYTTTSSSTVSRAVQPWAAALAYEPIETPPEVVAEVEKAIAAGELDPTGWAMLVNPDGTGPRLLFQRRPKGSTQDIPIHLDLPADDRVARSRAAHRAGSHLRARALAENRAVRGVLDGNEGPRRQPVLRLVTPLDRTSPRVMRVETAASLRLRQTAPGTLSWSSRSARN
jgi:Glyoxalase-like domain